jgi:hypothetical protein
MAGRAPPRRCVHADTRSCLSRSPRLCLDVLPLIDVPSTDEINPMILRSSFPCGREGEGRRAGCTAMSPGSLVLACCLQEQKLTQLCLC